VNNANDTSNCGTCGFACLPAANAIPVCVSGTCSETCNTNYVDCDQNLRNGCEFTCLGNIITTTLNTSVTTYPYSPTCPEIIGNLTHGAIPRDGTGDANGNFIVVTSNGIQLGLRAEQRIVGNYIPEADTNWYVSQACPSAGTKSTDNPIKAAWNFGFSVDLRATSPPLTLADFNSSITITDLTGTITGLPQTLDVQGFAQGLIFGICSSSCGTAFFPFMLGGVNFTNCTQLINNGSPLLNFVQESSNLAFSVPNFPFAQPAIFQVTLSLTPKISCACPISVSMFVSVETPSSGKCPPITCVAPYIDCDGNGANLCEVNKSNDTKNCGGCGNACAAVQTCVNGVCT